MNDFFEIEKKALGQMLSPCAATFPVQDKFGQVVMFHGFTKIEAVAMQLFLQYLPAYEDVNAAAKDAFKDAEIFLIKAEQAQAAIAAKLENYSSTFKVIKTE